MYYVEKQIFYVNSKMRNNFDSSTDSSFNYTFLNLDKTKDFDHVSVLSASIPKSYYLLQSGLNSFSLLENSTQVAITLTPGNYNRNSLATTVKNLLNSNSPNGWIYNVTFNNINTTFDNGFYYFSVTGNSSIQPSFIFTNGIFEPLGFNSNSTYQFSSNALSSVNVPNLSIETTLFIHSNICQNKEGDNVLQEIYDTGQGTFSYINFVNPIPMEYSKPMPNSNSNTFTFWLTDENGNIVNLNGVNLNLTIMIFKKNDIDNLLKAGIKYLTMIT
jgi:hypothetical protein